MKSDFLLISKSHTSAGFVIPFCGLLLIVLFGMASYMIDIGHARYQLRNLQIAADAASRAGLIPLGQASPNYTKVSNEVIDIASRNAVAQAEIVKSDGSVGIECGTWSGGVFNSQGSVCTGASTAVKVSMKRQVQTFFGKIFNINSITPVTSAVSAKLPINQCIRPFVISSSLLTVSGTALVVGDTFDTGLLSSGNWGKLDPDPTNGGPGFDNNSMSTNACHAAFKAGPADTEQGFSSVKQAFDNALANPSFANGMVFAVTSASPQGNSPNAVPIVEYIRADLIAVYGNNANNWHASFRVVARSVTSDPDPVKTFRKLVF